MLIEFKVTNFRSIREQQTFSLVAGNVDRDQVGCLIDRELPGLAGVRLLKGAAIYGANASGKSNVIEAMDFVTRFVQRSATKIQPGDQTGAEPFKLDAKSRNEPSKFEISFVAEGDRYVFGFSTTPARVIEEYLVAYPKGAPQRWYHREYDLDKKEYRWARPSSAFKQDKSLQEKTRENSLFLSVGPQFNHPQLTQVFNWFKNSVRFIHLSADSMLLPEFTARMMSRPEFHDRIINLIRSADIGIVDAVMQEKDMDLGPLKKTLSAEAFAEIESKIKQRKEVKVSLSHRCDGEGPVHLDFEDEESAGTRRFFALLGPWIEILERGYTVFVDEIETSLHPLLVRELLRLLLCSQANSGGAQVIFTTHNPVLLDGSLMRRDQIWFTEKSPAGATNLYPLTDYQPRKDEALAKGYLAGRYGAIPYMPEGLRL